MTTNANVPFADVLLPTEDDEQEPEHIDLTDFVDSFGNRIGQPSERYLAVFGGRNPGNAYDTSVPSVINIRRHTPRQSFHAGGSRQGIQSGYSNIIDSPEFTELWRCK